MPPRNRLPVLADLRATQLIPPSAGQIATSSSSVHISIRSSPRETTPPYISPLLELGLRMRIRSGFIHARSLGLRRN